MAEIILVCKWCDKQPVACKCERRGNLGDQSREWLRQEPVLRIRDLRVPLYLAKGQLEYLTDEELNEYNTDLQHELTRRARNEFSTLAEYRLDGESG